VGITAGMVRIAMGLEAVEDIIEYVEGALG